MIPSSNDFKVSYHVFSKTGKKNAIVLILQQFKGYLSWLVVAIHAKKMPENKYLTVLDSSLLLGIYCKLLKQQFRRVIIELTFTTG